MKRILALVLSVVMIVTLASCASAAPAATTAATTKANAATTAAATTAAGTTAASGGKIYIGVSAGLTGDAPLEGEIMKKSVTLACEKINAAGGVLNGQQFVPVFEDDTYTAEGTIVVANKFVSDKKIVAIVGLGRSNGVTAISSIVKDAGMPTLTTGTSTSFYKLNNPYIFRLRATDAVFYTADAKYVVEKLGAKKIGVAYETDDWGLSGFSAAEAQLKKMGVEYISSPVNSDVIDTSGQILKFKDAGCDGVILILHQAIGSIFCRQMLELNWKPKATMASTAFMINAFYDLVTEQQSDGLYIACDFNNKTQDPFIRQFIADYAKRWSTTEDKVDVVAALHYNHMLILADAIKRAGAADRESIAKALRTTKDVMTTLGPMTCDSRGDMVSVCNIFQNKGKVPTIVENNYKIN